MTKRERTKDSEVWRIAPPSGAVSLLRSPTAADYIGLSLHQGSLPFVSLNGIHITFSPFLLGFIALLGISSSLYIDHFPESLLFPLLALLLLFAQLAGNLLIGYMMSVQPQSLILSLSGVIDPGLIFSQSPNPADNTPRFDNHTPLRALGSSIGAALFLFALSQSPIEPELFSEAGMISYAFWMYGCFIIIAPFLPPHRMNDGVLQQTATSALFPIVILGSFYLLTVDKSVELPFSIGTSEIAFFFFALLLRGYWWSRITSLSKIAQKITIGEAMIPFSELNIFTHGETISSAQIKALKDPQSIFPIISGHQLIGYIEREILLRIPYLEQDEETFISEIAIQSVHCVDPSATLENAFGPELPLPVFVMEDEEILGVITADQVRDALILALSGHPRFPKVTRSTTTSRELNLEDDN